MDHTMLVTGGAGFIGSNLVLKTLAQTPWRVVNVDKLTYSGNPDSLKEAEKNPKYRFFKADIGDAPAMEQIITEVKPDAIMHLAAESHVDRSIDSPAVFIDTNIKGTYNLLEASRHYWKNLKSSDPEKAARFRFLHISTDEVFGDLADQGPDALFNENTPYAPSSPYSASKAASDHLVHAWFRTYGLPTIITNCSNNYGPRQFPEKLIPLTILNAIAGRKLPVYGKGQQIRDWLFVDDHADALLLAISRGQPGEVYTVGGKCEKKNIDVVNAICECLEEIVPNKPAGVARYSDLIEFVTDRPGHDGRYAIDPAKIGRELGWEPKMDFSNGLKHTIRWYLDNEDWWRKILAGTYQGQRLGTNI